MIGDIKSAGAVDQRAPGAIAAQSFLLPNVLAGLEIKTLRQTFFIEDVDVSVDDDRGTDTLRDFFRVPPESMGRSDVSFASGADGQSRPVKTRHGHDNAVGMDGGR